MLLLKRTYLFVRISVIERWGFYFMKKISKGKLLSIVYATLSDSGKSKITINELDGILYVISQLGNRDYKDNFLDNEWSLEDFLYNDFVQFVSEDDVISFFVPDSEKVKLKKMHSFFYNFVESAVLFVDTAKNLSKGEYPAAKLLTSSPDGIYDLMCPDYDRTFEHYDGNILFTDGDIRHLINESVWLYGNIRKMEKVEVSNSTYSILLTVQDGKITDMGIRNSFLDFRQSEEVSHTMENVIYIELKKRGYNVDVGSVEIREGDAKKQLEIDFVANKGNNKIYIQSALEMKTTEKVKQEQKSLLNVNDFFKKIIIVGNDIKRSRYDNGIILMSIYDFLLDANSLDY